MPVPQVRAAEIEGIHSVVKETSEKIQGKICEKYKETQKQLQYKEK